MPPLVTYTFLVFASGYVVLLLVELLDRSSRRAVLWQSIAFLVGLLVLHFSTGFPSFVQPFSVGAELLSILVVLVGVLFGIGANYCFYSRGGFRWVDFLKPLVLSPLVLLPLLGSLQVRAEMTAVQWVSIFCLGFQNGFFWRMVTKHVKNKPS
jgi:hypothetical protein